MELNHAEQKIALQIARKSLEAHFAGQNYIPETNGLNIFSETRGVFVTLHRQGELRGCIGNFEPSQPLSKNIESMTLAAALEDNRFNPLTIDELSEIDIEISVLSPMRKIFSADEIELGKHGVYFKQGKRSGVFLPQVAEETGWDKETFLNALCVEKAGLDPYCWRDPKTEIFIFTAQVFEE